MRQTFSVAFYCRESKVTRHGTAAVEMSLIINGRRSFMSLPMKMRPSEFQNLYSQRRSNQLKEFCQLYERKVNEAVRLILENGKPLTPETVKSVMLNGIQNSYKLSEMFREHLSLVAEKTRGGLTLSTYRKYELAFGEFLKSATDKEAKSVTNSDVEKFITHLNLTHQPATVRGYLNKVKSAYLQAIRDDKLRNNPFAGIKIRNPRSKIEILTEEEYEAIRDKRFDIPRLEKVRKLFVLACNCGLAYADLMLLTADDVREKDGVRYIQKCRKKTGVEYTAVILEDGIGILGEIDGLKLSNQKCNSYLAEIQDLCRIKHHLTMHKARHFYVTTLLRRNINPEIVRQCAGHSKLSMTQRYLHIMSDDVINAFK